jgi:hypothetical protein
VTGKSKSKKLTCCKTILSELRFLENICDNCEYRILAQEEDYELSLGSDLYYESRTE